MDSIRKAHNLVKRNLIQKVVPIGAHVLDVGCGRGGDLQKWAHCGVRLDACDPDKGALDEAKARSRNIGYRVNFYHGEIFECPKKEYDVICYNFSIQYIFRTPKVFFKTLEEIKKRLKPGGKLFGCVPDSEEILNNTPFNDSLGNFLVRKDDTGYGNFGEKVFVNLVDTPYYNDGPIPEPIAYKDLLITHLELNGFRMELWEGFDEPYEISKLYSKFIFVLHK